MNKDPDYLVLFLFLVVVVLVGFTLAYTFNDIFITHGNIYYHPKI